MSCEGTKPTSARRRGGPCGQLAGLSHRLSKFRRLTQPYFLRLDGASGWQFTWLIACVMFLVTGATLLVITLMLSLIKRLQPEIVDKLLSGDSGFFGIMFGLWGSPGGLVIALLCLLACGSFAWFRTHLRVQPWLLLGGVVLVLLLVNLVSTGIGFIARDLTNALVKRKEDESYDILVIYGACFLIALPIRSLQFYFQAKLSLLWREWLAGSLIDSYMGHRAYYDLKPNDEEATEVDNPDQRIAHDAKSFTKASLSFTVGAFDALMTFVLNILVLWSISHVLTWTLFIYSGTSTVILILASHKLVRLNYDQLRYEADFRYGLVHIRDNAEAIAFYGGEGPEKAESKRRLRSVVGNYHFLIKWEVIISMLQHSYGYAGYFFPYLVLIPAYIRGELDYGDFVQAKFAFSMVEYALSFVVNNIDEMANWWAGISRLEGFLITVETINQKGERDVQSQSKQVNDLEEGGHQGSGTPQGVVLRQVRVEAPGSQQVLVDDLNLSVGQGQRVLVVGASGCGKTSLLRIASGLWRPQAGTVERPPVGELLFVPQKPYMLLGSLREQLCYPLLHESFADEALHAALTQVRLGHLVERYPDLNVKQDWPRVLSLGEQQRLAFARLLLNSPQFAVLDEATSALDVSTERMLYELLSQRGVAIISVGHRPSLAAFHDQVLELQGQGAWRLMPSASYHFNEGERDASPINGERTACL